MLRALIALPFYLAMLIAAAAGPSMSSAWSSITIDQDECVRRGEAAVRGNSFTTRFETLGNSSIYGELGDYTALLRCAADKGMAYVVIAGPIGKEASRYMNAIRDSFTASLSGAAPAAAAPSGPASSEKSGGSSSSAVSPASPTDNIAGRYSIEGANPNGSTYGGEVNITVDSGVYDFRWRISNGDTYRGKGRLRGKTLSVDWGQQYPVIYQVGDDGTLRGKWANGRASENLVPNR